jgi:methylmalonyl-CoA/ethylmalonyl-CoA epimerase
MKRVHPKLRHIAISVPDVARAQKFFEEAFGMEKVGNAGRGVYMSDGTINVALLDYQGEAPTGSNGPHLGLLHFGMWVDNLAEAEAQVKAAGGKHLHGRPPDRPNTFYEVKYADPDGVVFDLTESGWKGAQKNVVPAK